MFLISSIAGLPAHPLVVHGAVILVPLAVLALVATGWKESWQKQYGLPVMLLAVAGAVFAWLADSSGEPLEHALRDAAAAAGEARPTFGEHPEEGERAMTLAMAFGGLAIVYWAAVTTSLRERLPTWAPRAAYAAASIAGIGALFAIVAAGHSGASLAWKETADYIR